MFQRLLLRRRRRLMLIFVILLAVLIVVSIARLLSRDSGASEPAIAGITCERERLDFHIHVRLSIFVNGQRREVPEGLGIRDGCLYWLHTHDASGLIHIEAPSPGEFRLGPVLRHRGGAAEREAIARRRARGWPQCSRVG